MLPSWRLRPTRRRLASTAVFVAFWSVLLVRFGDTDVRGMERGTALWVLAILALLGYLRWSLLQADAMTRRWRSFRERAWKTAGWMAGGVVAVLAVDALVTGDLDFAGMPQGWVVPGAMLLYVLVMPRIASGRSV